jgi:hypothetical protein
MAVPEPTGGVLYLVGTPIGNLEDLSPRARRVLGAVDLVACEDTRRSGLLLHGLGLRNRLLSFHEHNRLARQPQLLQALAGQPDTVAPFAISGTQHALPGLPMVRWGAQPDLGPGAKHEPRGLETAVPGAGGVRDCVHERLWNGPRVESYQTMPAIVAWSTFGA